VNDVVLPGQQLVHHDSQDRYRPSRESGGSTEYRLIIDPATGQAFATEQRDAAGELTYYELVDDAGFRDETPPTE
jgi:hypothetical protein